MSDISTAIITQILGTDITSTGDSAAIANSLGGFPNSTLYRNDSYDAFRHAYGSALLSEAFGDTISKCGMDNHEATNRDPNPDVAAKEENMDKYNNNVGREEYQRWQEAKDVGKTTDSLEKWIYDSVKAGKTINDLNDTRQWSEPASVWGEIKETVANLFTAAQHILPPRHDPLILDLDGDGIETTGFDASKPVYFDNDLNGIKEGTGWVKADDGLLVMDRNGNGVIDNGSELFGDHTLLATGGFASDGFAALAELDSNHDGKVDANDAGFNQLKVWRDLNQDGISQSDELFSLNSLQITAINLAKTGTSQDLGNGNQIMNLGSYSRSDGSTASIADVNLVVNSFYRQFSNSITLTNTAQTLPDMQGSGAVRDLHEAASLSNTLADLLSQFANATTYEAQRGLIDPLLKAWAESSGLAATLEQRAGSSYSIRFNAFATDLRSNHLTGLSATSNNDSDNLQLDAAYRNTIVVWEQRLEILEAFNGRHFFNLPNETQVGGNALTGMTVSNPGANSATLGTINISYTQEQLTLLSQSYEMLKDSVYSDLLLQTRLKPYLNVIGLTINESGIALDFTAMNSLLESHKLDNAQQTVADLLELQKYLGDKLNPQGWHGQEMLIQWAGKLDATPALIALMTEFGYNNTATAGNDILIGFKGADVVNGLTGNDSIYGGDGNDSITDTNGSDTIEGGAGDDNITDQGSGSNVIRGGDGNDSITFSYYANNSIDGGSGNDLIKVDVINYTNASYTNTFIGGAGNDRFQSGGSSDTYVFNRGDGQDVINDYGLGYYAVAAGTDKLVFGAGISSGDLVVSRLGNQLLIKITDPNNAATSDQIIIENWDNTDYRIEQIKFADGNVMTATQLGNLSMTGTETSETLSLWADASFADAKAGNDTILSGASNATIYGGDGNDSITDTNGSDTIEGGAGDDNITDQGSGSNVIRGGDGNDSITFSYYANNSIDGGSGNDLIKVDVINYTNASYTNTFIGGAGNDRFQSGGSSDTYVFNRGDGQDVINDYGLGYYAVAAGTDKLVFGAGISSGDLVVSRAGNNLLVKITDPNNTAASDQISIENWFISDGYRIENFSFTDSSSMNTSQINALALVITGSEDADTLTGWNENNTLFGLSGNDRIIGGAGKDILYGGVGSDQFVYQNLTDSGVGAASCDSIKDFSSVEGDVIDVRGIDANATLSGMQQWIFSPDGFTGVAGQVSFNAITHLAEFDNNGDKLADMQIEMLGVNSLSARDFVFV